MNFTLTAVFQSLENYLSPLFPDVNFYEDPGQENKQNPCMFLQPTETSLALQTGGYWLQTVGMELVYSVDTSLGDAQAKYLQAVQTLDLSLETFPYGDETTQSAVLLRTYERKWQVKEDGLHYQFQVKERVKVPKEYVKMQAIEAYNEEVRT